MTKTIILIAALLLAGCEHFQTNCRIKELPRVQNPAPAPAQALNVHFLGTGGLYLQADGVSLLADPFFTNPPLWRVVWPFPTASNEGLIKEQLTRLPNLDQLQAILVTHSHYDHAMDLPSIIAKYPRAHVYGSETLKLSLGDLADGRFCNLDGEALDPTQAHAVWISIPSRVRIAAIQSEHFSHFFGITYANGPFERPPSRLYDWRLGDTYSFVIDILAETAPYNPVFRIFYMPSAATHPIGTPPAAILNDGKAIDLAVLGASQLEKDENYPGALLRRIKPKAIMMVHWEDFFDKYENKDPWLNYGVDPDMIADRITAAIGKEIPVYWPQRGAVLELRPDTEAPGRRH